MAKLMNHEILNRYQQKRDRAKKQIRPKMYRVIRAVLSLNDVIKADEYYGRQIIAVCEAMEQGRDFRQPKPPKKERMLRRKIEL